ncbi:hypothetical protein MUK42_07932 [Musa troglodytarum]|uniref:Uncharacterized protein n=1 Tax=Musa troglodytarum TaxID=320322 RepID=A0A9E7J9K5_9LILI|nr:hypothetical protein MUK42_07932 [Musa troglodytarum]
MLVNYVCDKIRVVGILYPKGEQKEVYAPNSFGTLSRKLHVTLSQASFPTKTAQGEEPTHTLMLPSPLYTACSPTRRSLSLGRRQPKGTQRGHRRRQREGARVSLVVRQRAVGVQLPGDKRRSAQRAGALPVLQPPVDAVPVEHVAAVSHPPHLVGALELVEAHRAALRQAAAAALRGDQLPEPDRRRALLEQLGRERAGPRVVVMCAGVRVVPLGFRLHQGAEAEAEAVEDPVDEPSQVGEEEEQVEQQLRELGVANREPHVGIEDPKRLQQRWWKNA